MRQWIGSSLVQVMACRLFGAKPLPEPILEQVSVNFVIFIQENAFANVVCQNGGHFVQGRRVN